MIRKTLQATKAATFSIDLPNSQQQGMPTPTGTGFFVSPDGWFVTAAHVIMDRGTNAPRGDLDKAWLMQPPFSGHVFVTMYQHVTLDHVDLKNDFALLKVDFAANTSKESLEGQTGFPFIEVSLRPLEEGEPVYAFGYPLPLSRLVVNDPTMTAGVSQYSPRVTSAIVSSTLERSLPATTGAETRVYVLDKALNYGNSGGPIIAMETGRVHALCSRFQPATIPQPQLSRDPNKPIYIVVPSLYGIVSSLSNPEVVEALTKRSIPISDK